MILANYHTHTTFCDGADTAEEMVRRAIALGFHTLGFSAHMDGGIPMDLSAYRAEIRRLQQVYAGNIDILCGVELDLPYTYADAADLDYRIGSTHYLPIHGELVAIDLSDELWQTTCREHFGGDPYRLTKAYYELEATVVDRLHPTFLGHFDLVSRFNDEHPTFDENDRRYLTPALEAMEQLVRTGTPFEINAGAYNRRRKREFYPNRTLLRALCDFGGEILFSTDAHSADLLQAGLADAAAVAKECGFTHYNLLRKDSSGKLHWVQQPL